MKNPSRPGPSGLKWLLAGKGAFYSPGSELPRGKGSYVLVMEVTRPIKVRTKYGERELSQGTYAYVGSAFGPGGIRARISRHWKREKKKRWHIDWITTSEHCRHIGAYVFPGERIESDLSREMGKHFEPVPGFGASDSEEDSHLFVVRGET